MHDILGEEMFETGSEEYIPETIPSPKAIKEYMDQYIVGQEKAKIALSVAGVQPL